MCRGEQEWGDGLTGMAMSIAQYSLLKVQETEPHIKNWRYDTCTCIVLINTVTIFIIVEHAFCLDHNFIIHNSSVLKEYSTIILRNE